MKPYFIWNNENSLDNKIVVTKLPQIIRAAERANKIIIDGRNGFLVDSDSTFDGVVKTVECILLEDADIDYICKWLSGKGEIVFSNEPDKFYEAYLLNQIPIESYIRKLKKFPVVFDCQPFKKSFENTIEISQPTIIYNEGSIISEPKLKIEGTGDITLTINGRSFSILGLTDYVIVDSELMDCYKENQLMNNKMVGDFPYFDVGENSISWIGNITKLEITPNWRWL